MADLSGFRRDYLLGVETRIQRGATILQNRLVDACPVSPDQGGTMRDSIEVRVDGTTVSVVVGVDYASFTREDTEPHIIRARRGRALRFFWPKVGPPQPRFYAKVNHPGTSGVVDWYGEVLDTWNEILEQVA